MIYSNRNYRAEEREFEWGKIWQIAPGEFGRGRKAIVLTCPPALELKSGLNAGVTIGLTKSGKPRITKGEDPASQLYMLISSAGGYTRRGDGKIYVPKSQIEKVEVMARGNGADGIAGRIGSWDVLLMYIKDDVIIRNRTSGAGYGTPTDYYIVKDKEVFHCEGLDQLEQCLDVQEINPPFAITHDEENGTQINLDEWQRL